MKYIKRTLCALLAAAVLTGFTSCGNNGAATGTTTNSDSDTPKTETPLVVAYDSFGGKFNPFFSDTTYDSAVVDMVSVRLLTVDRGGAVIENAIESEKSSYNGTEYTYNGIADISISYDEAADITTYVIKLRDNVKFSDGQILDADDVIFSYYVLCDPTYTGSQTVYSVPIVGLQDYRTQTTSETYSKFKQLAEAIISAGADYTPTSADSFTEEQKNLYFSELYTAWLADVEATIDYVAQSYISYADEGFPFAAEEVTARDELKPLFAMYVLGLADFSGETISGSFTGNAYSADNLPSLSDFYNEVFKKHGGNPSAYSAEDSVNEPDLTALATDAFIKASAADDNEEASEIKSISGIRKLDSSTLEIKVNGFDASAVYSLCDIRVAPLHYYGDPELYDYENESYGFKYGELSTVSAKTSVPLGAGPYRFMKFENKIVYFEANDEYWRGKPLTRYVQFKETSLTDRISALTTGAADISTPVASTATFDEIKSYNSNGETTGDKITLFTSDYAGYGYIGLNAERIKVGDDPFSYESLCLRKAITTMLSVYRELAVDSYFGELAKIINYPVSDTSWAAPQRTDESYRKAYSVDKDGNAIFSAAMTSDEMYDAALAAAKSFLEEAGYTFGTDGKISSAPSGASTQYEVVIGAGGDGNHPVFSLLTSASQRLAQLGLTLNVTDVSDSNALFDKLNAGTNEIWVAAWTAGIDPDLYQVYHSDGIPGRGGSGSNYFHLDNPELDEKILAARKSSDRAYRKTLYKECYDIIMDDAVILPVYQRLECVIFNTQSIDVSTLTPDITPYWTWTSEIEKLMLK